MALMSPYYARLNKVPVNKINCKNRRNRRDCRAGNCGTILSKAQLNFWTTEKAASRRRVLRIEKCSPLILLVKSAVLQI
jgi:hypothetical protein